VLVGAGAVLVGSGRLAADPVSIGGGLLAFVGALVAAIVASFLLGAAAFGLGSAGRGLSHPALLNADAKAEISRRGDSAGFGFVGYGLAGIIALIIIAILPGVGTSLTPGDVVLAIAGALVCWLAASLVLLVVCSDLSAAISYIQPRLPGSGGRNAIRLRRYSFLNVLGVLSVAIPLGGLGSPTNPSLGSAMCILGVGGVLGGVLVPMAGLLAFTRLARVGLDMSRAAFPSIAIE
jgi:hypothetical protein